MVWRPELVRSADDGLPEQVAVVMPGMTGRELAEKVSAKRPDVKILYTTGYTRNAIVHQGVLDRGVALLQKPFTVSQLAARLRELLDGG